MFARIENNAVVEWPIASLAPLFPSTSFPAPITDADLPDGYVIVRNAAPPQTDLVHTVVPANPVFDGETWVQGWSVVPLTEQDLADRAAQQDAARKQAYQDEADPLYFKWQRGEATQQDWLGKIAEIKARFPDA